MTFTFEYRLYRPIVSKMKVEQILTILPLQMRPPSHPKVVPWDQLLFLLKSPLYIMYFRHTNREHFQKRPKTGKPAAHRFRIIKIRFLGTFRYILATQHFGFSFQKRRPGLMVLPSKPSSTGGRAPKKLFRLEF